MKRTMFLLPILFAILSSCTKGELVNDTPFEDHVTVESTVNKTVLLELVNNVRKTGCQCGDTYYPAAPAITWNNLLEAAAYAHANDMFQNKYFSHTAPDGSNAGVRIDRAGYKWTSYGENIASGHKNETEVVKGWIASPGHCKNIMNKSYKEMGVARVGNIWTQEFGSR
ncbi:MAG: CAP domain-containing protein [Flavisolibacter sp.]